MSFTLSDLQQNSITEKQIVATIAKNKQKTKQNKPRCIILLGITTGNYSTVIVT